MIPAIKLLVPSLLMACMVPVAQGGDFSLKQGDRLAIIGDSITEQKIYSVYLELYIVACAPKNDVLCMQYGWGGQWSGGFNGTMENNMMPWRPTVATFCFGMNDGQYRPFDPAIGSQFEKYTDSNVKRLVDSGSRVIVGTPGAVDTFTFHHANVSAQLYNASLEQLGMIAGKIAGKYQQTHADLHSAMMEAMVKAKLAYGEAYAVCGGDGIHPAANGHLVMAYTFLRALGMKGDIGTLTVDWTGKCTATAGHTVTGSEKGIVRVVSERYPFCFGKTGDKLDNPDNARGFLPFLPFQKDLNRLMLVVRNLPGGQAQVKWGSATKQFSREQLENGINLADEFLDNPFSEPFARVKQLVHEKQCHPKYYESFH